MIAHLIQILKTVCVEMRINMEFISFADVIKEEIERRTEKYNQIKINDVIKNNGIVLKGITISQNDSNISPTIYLNHYYEAFENGLISIEAIVEGVMESYEKNKIRQSIDIKSFMDFEQIKDKIIFKLVSTNRNVELLSDVPHIPFLDLSVVFQCLITEDMFDNATILIHNAHLKLWGVSIDELYEIAKKNTPKLQQMEIRNMKDILKQVTLEDEDIITEAEMNGATPMYVLSNKMRVHGAACLLYDDILKDFAQALNRDIFILPSSIHEVILLPAFGNEDYDGLKQMVKEVNETQVEPEEVLSDSVYYFDKKSEQIYII